MRSSGYWYPTYDLKALSTRSYNLSNKKNGLYAFFIDDEGILTGQHELPGEISMLDGSIYQAFHRRTGLWIFRTWQHDNYSDSRKWYFQVARYSSGNRRFEWIAHTSIKNTALEANGLNMGAIDALDMPEGYLIEFVWNDMRPIRCFLTRVFVKFGSIQLETDKISKERFSDFRKRADPRTYFPSYPRGVRIGSIGLQASPSGVVVFNWQTGAEIKRLPSFNDLVDIGAWQDPL